MKQYKVTFEWFNGNGGHGRDSVTVEAGNKKAAWARGLSELSANAQYKDCYKQIISVEEAA